MQIIVVDTETSGINPEEGAALLEVAHVCLDKDYGHWSYGENGTYGSDFIVHEGDIPAVARAVHHISPEDVKLENGALPRDAWLHSILAAEDEETLYAAHNADFDRQFLPELQQPWLCTWRISLHLYPDAPSHSAQCLRYHLGCEPPTGMLEGLTPHRAGYDAACTAALLHRMLEEHSVEELLRLTTAPVELTTCRFGKHRGMKWSEVPLDYCRWIVRDGTFDKDVMYTVQRRLGLV